MGPAGEPIEAVFREERGRLLALLAARFGDLDLAEEVTAEALLSAVETWPRRHARVDDQGFAVSLEDQDRGLWDASMIGEGARLTTQALRDHPPNSWSVQAAIAALHDEAPSAQETDWRQVRLLYDELFALTPTPVIALNRAIAISWHEGPQAGLDHLEALAGEPGLARQHHWHAARGHMLARLGHHTAAAEAYRQASQLAQTPAEIAYLCARAEEHTTAG
jgi:RNA polymerase sigma-70 factor, ECF subfamily